MSDDTELTPEEKMAFDSLPREASPSDFLEERIVHALREDGILHGAPGSPGSGRREPRRSWGWPWAIAAASMAASLVLFGSGVLVGQWMGTRSAERIMLAVREQDNARVAQSVQEAGSAYVRALVALAEFRDSQAAGGRGARAAPSDVPSPRVASEIRQGGEAALGALYAAALELSRLTPHDPDVARILQILEDRRFAPAGENGAATSTWH